jgi:hypothetical protein
VLVGAAGDVETTVETGVDNSWVTVGGRVASGEMVGTAMVGATVSIGTVGAESSAAARPRLPGLNRTATSTSSASQAGDLTVPGVSFP